MGASSAGSYEVTPPGRSRASDAAHRADRSTQRQQPTRQAYGESDPTGDAIPILTGLRSMLWPTKPRTTRPWPNRHKPRLAQEPASNSGGMVDRWVGPFERSWMRPGGLASSEALAAEIDKAGGTRWSWKRT
jgi:hypothetical protein